MLRKHQESSASCKLSTCLARPPLWSRFTPSLLPLIPTSTNCDFRNCTNEAYTPGRRLFCSPAKLPTTQRFLVSLPTGSPQPILQRVQLCPAQLQAMSLGSLHPPAAAVQATARRSPSAARCPRGAARLREVRGWASGHIAEIYCSHGTAESGESCPATSPASRTPHCSGLGRGRYVPEKAAVADDTTTPLAHRVRQRIWAEKQFSRPQRCQRAQPVSLVGGAELFHLRRLHPCRDRTPLRLPGLAARVSRATGAARLRSALTYARGAGRARAASEHAQMGSLQGWLRPPGRSGFGLSFVLSWPFFPKAAVHGEAVFPPANILLWSFFNADRNLKAQCGEHLYTLHLDHTVLSILQFLLIFSRYVCMFIIVIQTLQSKLLCWTIWKWQTS